MPFKDSSNGAGGFYRPTPGMLKGEFLGVEDGPTLQFEGKDSPQMRWKWRLFNMDDTPVMYVPKDAEGKVIGDGVEQQAEIDALSTEATGNKSKARKWLAAHKGGTAIEGAMTGAQFMAAVDEVVQAKTKVFLVFGPNADNSKVVVANIIPITAA